jgi:hypothetical protein
MLDQRTRIRPRRPPEGEGRRGWPLATSVALVAIAVGNGACRSRPRETTTTDGASPLAKADQATDAGAGASAAVDLGPMASGIPVPAARVDAERNPRHLPPFSGPTGAVEGVVRVSGDPAPKLAVQIPFVCGEAYATHGKAFREGNGRTLGDVMVAVTQYDGFVPPSSDVYPVTIRGCAYDKRTLALTYGQRIEVQNADATQSFLPTLIGADLPAQNVAMPRGDPVKLYPLQVGHYALTDGMKRTWMYGDVFVLHYATHTVTGLDGHYRIAGVPAGKVKVSAYLPAIDAGLHPEVGVEKSTVERELEIKPGETVQADFVIPYKAPKLAPPRAPRPSEPTIR